MTIYVLSIIVVLILGAIVGSFLNTVIFRYGLQGTSVKGRSKCPKCGKQLSAKDLVPIISWILLQGRCRYCHAKISPQYLLIELVTGLIFVGAFIFTSHATTIPTLIDPAIFQLLLFWIISSFLIVIFVIDLMTNRIKNRVLLYFAPFVLAWVAVNGGVDGLVSGLYGALVIGLLFWLLVIASKEKWMGAGDAKFALVIGFAVGWPAVTVLMTFAFVAGAVVGLALIARGQASRQTALPFGTFLAAATWLALMYGETIAHYFFLNGF